MISYSLFIPSSLLSVVSRVSRIETTIFSKNKGLRFFLQVGSIHVKMSLRQTGSTQVVIQSKNSSQRRPKNARTVVTVHPVNEVEYD